jgi:uncharacterized Tic20 family protein
MEHLQRPMTVTEFNFNTYIPNDSEREKASFSYLMSVVSLMAGLPLPIINLIASLIFLLGNRNATFFVRWHCMQALLSQLTVFVMNVVGFSWTMKVVFSDAPVSNHYIAYIITIIIFNLYEIVANIISAIKVREGKHKSWWFWGELTDLIMKNKQAHG